MEICEILNRTKNSYKTNFLLRFSLEFETENENRIAFVIVFCCILLLLYFNVNLSNAKRFVVDQYCLLLHNFVLVVVVVLDIDDKNVEEIPTKNTVKRFK